MASVKRTIQRNGSQIKRAIAYARFSSNNQREESIDAQLRAIREYCEKNGIVLVDINSLNKELDSINKKQEMLTDLLLEGEIDKAMLNEKNAALKQRKFEIEEELEKRKMVVGSDNVTEEMIVKYIREYIDYLKTSSTADDELMRAVLNEFVEKVEVDKETITVHISCDFSRMGDGDNVWFSGVSQHLAPVKLNRRFNRKRNVRDRN